MKTLLILRHGKAQQTAPRGDKARVLVVRGEDDAALMGRLIEKVVHRVDGVVSSDAARAHKTAEIAAEAARFRGKIKLEPDIYNADLDTLLKIVRALPDDWDCALLVGHNPGCEQLAEALAAEGTEPVELPTAGLARLAFEGLDRWRDVREGTGNLVAVYRPKDYRDATP